MYLFISRGISIIVLLLIMFFEQKDLLFVRHTSSLSSDQINADDL
jgi:hypothetical protein